MTSAASIHTARDEADLQSVIADAAADGRRLRLRGGDSKAPLLGGIAADTVLDLSALSGVVAYEPGELVLSVRAGTPLLEVQALLAQQRQALAFEPQDYAGLLSGAPGRTTLGGIVASGWAGPRRIAAGNVRDHVLGVTAVSGRGERFCAGGRVIKNVTGYDLPKLLTGAWGTLAAMTEITLRALPQPPYQCTLSLENVDDAGGLAGLREALGLSTDVTGAALLPRDRRALLRLEGFESAVAEILRALQQHFGGRYALRVLDDEPSMAVWRRVAEVWDFQGQDERAIWRCAVPADRAAAVVGTLQAQMPCEAVYDWGGALVWLATDADEATASGVRDVLQKADGHAWLFRAPSALRAAVIAAHPAASAIAALSRRIKQGFDPCGILPTEPLWRGA